MQSAATAHRVKHFGHYLAHAFEKWHHMRHEHSDEHSTSTNHPNRHFNKFGRSISDYSQRRIRPICLRQLSSELNLYKQQSINVMGKAPMKRLSSNDSITSGTEVATSLCQPHIRLRFSDDNISMAQ